MDEYSFIILILFAINLGLSSYLFSEKRKTKIDYSFMFITGALVIVTFQHFCILTINTPIAFKIVLKTMSVTYIFIPFIFLNFFFDLLNKPKNKIYYVFLILCLVSMAAGIITNYPFDGFEISKQNAVIYFHDYSKLGLPMVSLFPIVYGMILIFKKYKKMKKTPYRNAILMLFLGLIASFIIASFLYNVFTKHILGTNPLIKKDFSMDKINALTRSIIMTMQVFLIFLLGKKYKFLSLGIKDISKNLFEDIEHGAIIVSPDEIIINANENACSLFNQKREEIVNINVKQLIPAYDSLNMKIENEIETQRGKTLSVYPSKILLNNVEMGRVLMLRDISHEKAMRKDLNLKSRVFDNMNEAVFVLNTNAQIIEWNKAAEKMFGYAKQEVMLKKPNRIFYTQCEIKSQMTDKIHDLIIGGEQWQGEIDYVTKDGEIRIREAIIVPLYSGDEITEIVGINRDITEKKKYDEEREKLLSQLELTNDEIERANEELETANDELERANFELYSVNEELRKLSQMKDDFLSVASHDLRSPFNGILGFSEILLNEENLDDMHKELVGYIKQSAETQLRYVNDILDIIRFESGNIKLEAERVKLAELVQISLHSLGILAENKNINIIPEIKTQEYANVDAAKITQVINNLISNAIKFTRPGGIIYVKLFENECKEFEIHVSDNGMGIPKEKLEKLFTRYEQVHTQGTGGEAGTGLGLSICKQLIEVHGGKIGVESEPDIGSDFYFTIPMSEKA